MPKNRKQGELTAAIRRGVPRRHGVYWFCDGDGNTIYIGKSVNLRSRVLSYFRQNGSGLEDRIRQMVFHIDAFHFRETPTELLALLLEDALIKRELPIYNIKQREYEACRYLLLTEDAYPAFRVLDRQEAARGSVFGPFRDEYLLADILRIVCRCFRLRTCADALPSRKCLNFDLSLCAGPCRNAISEEEYAASVALAVGFLNGDDAPIARKLEEEMAACAEVLNFEKAGELKRQLDYCRDFCARQRFAHGFKTGSLFVREQADDSYTYHFVNGNLIECAADPAGLDGQEIIPPELLQEQNDPRFVLDRANLVYDWLKRNAGTDSVRSLATLDQQVSSPS